MSRVNLVFLLVMSLAHDITGWAAFSLLEVCIPYNLENELFVDYLWLYMGADSSSLCASLVILMRYCLSK